METSVESATKLSLMTQKTALLNVITVNNGFTLFVMESIKRNLHTMKKAQKSISVLFVEKLLKEKRND